MKILKVLTLQGFWYLSVSHGHQYQLPIFFLGVALSFLNYYLYRPAISKGHYLFTLGLFVTYGLLQESLFEYLGLVNYAQEGFPFWLNSLYFIFIAYYGDIFNYMSKKSSLLLALIGAIGGVLSYYGGVKISPIEVLTPMYYLAIAIGWGIFFPLSFKVFYEGFMWNKILDASLYYSFDLSGYLRHEKEFNEDLVFVKGSKGIITGGTSGIGHAVAKTLTSHGIQVTVTGRNAEKGLKAIENDDLLSFTPWDMANWEEIESVTQSLEPLDFVVLNAGGMPDSFQTNKEGIELQFASQLFGHYFLIKKLKETGKLKDKAKIIWVTSGGMYLAKLDLSKVAKNTPYDKVSTYANVKRAQVTLLPALKEEFPDQIVTAMHPGWAATPGVSSAIPDFDKKMKGKLRSPLQGGDTILWLLCTKREVLSGGLYFDRKKVKSHFFWFTKVSEKYLPKLKAMLDDFTP